MLTYLEWDDVCSDPSLRSAAAKFGVVRLDFFFETRTMYDNYSSFYKCSWNRKATCWEPGTVYRSFRL